MWGDRCRIWVPRRQNRRNSIPTTYLSSLTTGCPPTWIVATLSDTFPTRNSRQSSSAAAQSSTDYRSGVATKSKDAPDCFNQRPCYLFTFRSCHDCVTPPRYIESVHSFCARGRCITKRGTRACVPEIGDPSAVFDHESLTRERDSKNLRWYTPSSTHARTLVHVSTRYT